MATKTWEVKLLAGNNGVIQTNVEADEYEWDKDASGLEFIRTPDDGTRVPIAFFSGTALLSVKDVTP